MRRSKRRTRRQETSGGLVLAPRTAGCIRQRHVGPDRVPSGFAWRAALQWLKGAFNRKEDCDQLEGAVRLWWIVLVSV